MIYKASASKERYEEIKKNPLLFCKHSENIFDMGRPKKSNHIQIAQNCKSSFEDNVLFKLLRCMNNKTNMTRHLAKLQNKNMISIDDHSIVVGF